MLSGYYYPTFAPTCCSRRRQRSPSSEICCALQSPSLAEQCYRFCSRGCSPLSPCRHVSRRAFPAACLYDQNKFARESRRRRDDPGRPSDAASLSRTVDANRYHGRHEGSCRKGQPSRSASRRNSAQHPSADSRCWTHGSLCSSRRGRESDRRGGEASDDVPPHWASLCLLHGVRSIGGVAPRQLRSKIGCSAIAKSCGRRRYNFARTRVFLQWLRLDNEQGITATGSEAPRQLCVVSVGAKAPQPP